MRKVIGLIAILFASSVFVSPAAVSAAGTYDHYISRFCTQVSPPNNCGGYQMQVNLANLKVNDFLTSLSGYPQTQQVQAVHEILRNMEAVINNYPE